MSEPDATEGTDSQARAGPAPPSREEPSVPGETVAPPAPRGRVSARRRGLSFLLCVVLALFALFATAKWVLVPYRVWGGSMVPTLLGRGDPNHPKAGDTVLASPVVYFWRDPLRWEVVVVDAYLPERGSGTSAGRDAEDAIAVKRIVALPGETVEVRDGSIWVDGSRLIPPPAIERVFVVSKGPFGRGPLKLGPDEYFLLGDQSYLSLDSRQRGAIARGAILARVLWIISPSSRMGWVR